MGKTLDKVEERAKALDELQSEYQDALKWCIEEINKCIVTLTEDVHNIMVATREHIHNINERAGDLK